MTERVEKRIMRGIGVCVMAGFTLAVPGLAMAIIWESVYLFIIGFGLIFLGILVGGWHMVFFED